MIKKLDWDSDFFGYPVAQVEFADEAFFTRAFKTEMSKYKLIYIVADVPIRNTDMEIELVDIKTKLVKLYPVYQRLDNNNLFEYNGHGCLDLEKLSIKSGLFSRFKKDKNFSNNEFEHLYIKWISESIKGHAADKVIIHQQENEAITGFISVQFKPDFAEIGLVAVDERKRGKQVATSLLKYVANEASLRGLDKICVTTQFDNVPAMNLYYKNGYEIISKKYIYHLWN